MSNSNSSSQSVFPEGASGARYLLKGFELITQKGLRRFVIFPLAINLILFSVAFYFLFQQMSTWIEQILLLMPAFLQWLDWLLWPLISLAVLLVMAFTFTAIMNFIAAPFNGLLAEQVELYLTGEAVNTGGALDVLKDAPRLLGREWTKLTYYIPRALICLIVLIFVPVIGPIIWFCFSAWMLAIQYLDYPFDNHKVPFRRMLNALGQQRWQSFSFGASAALLAMVPLVNLILMPAAICGATALWVDQHRNTHRQL